MSALLTLESVTAGFVTDIDILRDVTVRVDAGSITGLIGLNGAGKSTLLKTIFGLVVPKSGRIIYDGTDITGSPPHSSVDKGIWFIPQESSLFPYMRVGDNLLLPLEHLRRRGVLSRGDVSARLAETIDKFPVLGQRWKAQAGDLSGGQQKLVEIAKAQAIRPRLCVIDEPSIGLAPKIAGEVFEWIQAFARDGMSIFLVDHNIRRVVSLAARVYVLSLGEISAEGSAADFRGDLHEQVRAWLGIDL
jgi:branched-chain amino acid transport system ATP-binding protein